MSARAFYVAGDEVLFVANNPGGDARYAADRHLLPPRAHVPARQHATHETVIVVTRGDLEFMIGGATGHVRAGSFVRVPPGIAYGYRNTGDGPAQLLIRAIGPRRPAPFVNVTVSIAAA